jgi:hypothetical protein
MHDLDGGNEDGHEGDDFVGVGDSGLRFVVGG